MNNKSIIIMLIILIVVIIGIILLKKDVNQEITQNDTATIIQEEETINLEEVIQTEQTMQQEIKKALTQCEKDYREGVSRYSAYTRGDFYNETRLNKEMSEGELSFTVLKEIDINKAYDINGEKIYNFSETSFDIEDNYYLKDEKYYMLRCTTNTDYFYYYIVRISQNGFSELDWYCFTKDEDYYDSRYDLVPMEENLID